MRTLAPHGDYNCNDLDDDRTSDSVKMKVKVMMIDILL